MHKEVEDSIRSFARKYDKTADDTVACPKCDSTNINSSGNENMCRKCYHKF